MNYYEALSKLTGVKVTNQMSDALISALCTPVVKTVNDITFEFAKGIYFKCIHCGNCCKWQFVEIDKEEAKFFPSEPYYPSARISEILKFDRAPGIRIKQKLGQPCPMYKDGRCSCYIRRPHTCRMFPWSTKLLVDDNPKFKDWVILMVDNVDHPERMCQGFHLGKMETEQLLPFSKIFKKEIKKAFGGIK